MTYANNLLTITGPKVSRDAILGKINTIPDSEYFGVFVNGDVAITNCLTGDIKEASFLTKRDHITSFQATGKITMLLGEDDYYGLVDAGNLFYNLGDAAHPIKQLDVRFLDSFNIAIWSDAFVNNVYGINSFNWCGITGNPQVPDGWDWAKHRPNLHKAFQRGEPFLYHQIIMSPSSNGVADAGILGYEMLDFSYEDTYPNIKLFVNGVEDTSWSLAKDGMFKFVVLKGWRVPTDNTVYNFVVPDEDVSVGFYGAGGSWQQNDGSYKYMQEQTQKALQGIVPAFPSAPVRAGYKFLGWASSPDAKVPDVTQETIPQFGLCNCAYYAVWQQVSTITVNAGKGIFADGAHIKSLVKNLGDTLTENELGTPLRDGYKFLGWADAAGKTISFPYTIAFPTVTLTALWQLNPAPGPSPGPTPPDPAHTSDTTLLPFAGDSFYGALAASGLAALSAMLIGASYVHRRR